MKFNGVSKVGILVVAFIVIVIGGRFMFFPKTTTSPTSSATSSVQKATTPDVRATSEASQKTAPAAEGSVSVCAESLRTQTIQNKTNYERGSIVVGFTKEVSYADAKNVLALYGMVVQDETYARTNYGTLHLITAAVTPGQEFSKVCIIKRDAHVRYAGLNVPFALHE